ncbi:tryptophan 7-halogenase [Catenovulum sp. 2E275]|uniref:tryptophan halogenase family protein n=1 Tax=Catenovulum sp. 2E275 TaxID=2980497 RepID=UPI0021D2821A|nr:tryptophan halogenase family protein [Catenovulum sp. 2E275]MCU4674095.1 tryptophan 7-halogenase [Catenovulum sp. 2E275]
MKQPNQQHILIAGGGTAGWMSAAYLARHFKNTHFKISLVASEKMPSVGVGEATLPGIKDFYRTLGLSDKTVIERTQATVKLAISFEGWSKDKSAFFHPFGLYGQKQSNLPFHHCYYQLKQSQPKLELDDFCLAAQLARHHKVLAQPTQNLGDWAVFDYALHFDAGLYAKLLQDYAIEQGVCFIQDEITQINQYDNGTIQSVSVKHSGVIAADFFIDCTGFKQAIIRQTLNAELDDWSHWLSCNGAVVSSCEALKTKVPFTRSIAMPAGWRWQIPLQHRTGNGYVFNKDYISVDQACAELIAHLPEKPLADPRYIQFNTGRIKTPWLKNCLAIGLASGFLEPLESTSISMIETALERFLQLCPPDLNQADMQLMAANEYNRQNEREALNIRDFIILHYAASPKNDSDFWRAQKHLELPDSLLYKLNYFKQQGQIIQFDWESFAPQSWLAIYHGFNIHPQAISPLVKRIPPHNLLAGLSQINQHIQQLIANAVTPEEFIARLP